MAIIFVGFDAAEIQVSTASYPSVRAMNQVQRAELVLILTELHEVQRSLVIACD